MPGSVRNLVGESRTLRSYPFDFRLLGPERPGYRDVSSNKREFSAKDLGMHLLREYMDIAEGHRQPR
jgi:hypothetical protein